MYVRYNHDTGSTVTASTNIGLGLCWILRICFLLHALEAANNLAVKLIFDAL